MTPCFFKVYRDDYKSYFKTSDCSMDNVDDSISYCFRYGHLPIILWPVSLRDGIINPRYNSVPLDRSSDGLVERNEMEERNRGLQP